MENQSPHPPKKSLCIATANFKINLFNPKSSSLPSSLYIAFAYVSFQLSKENFLVLDKQMDNYIGPYNF